MVEKDEIFSGKVKQKGVFDFKELYRFAYTWIVDKGYFLSEKTYSEKVGAEGKEIEIEWEAKRKISDYFRFVLKVKWRIIGMKDADAERDGVKVTINKGLPEIEVKGVLEKDYSGKWEGSPFFKFLRGMYDRYLIRSRIESYEDKLFGDADEFLAQVKAFLSLEGMH